MTTFTFTTQGFEVGYAEDGFFAFGRTTNHEFDEREWQGPIPRFRGQPISWRIDTAGENQWDSYDRSVKERYPAPLTERAELLKAFFEECGPPVGMLWKWGPGSISLTYSLPPDPSFVAFLMGVLATERELMFLCPGFTFADEGKLAPAATVSGFMEREEPVFLRQRPLIRRETLHPIA